jgi:Putative antitoxin of bacterial toxin-antitoxin system, YdaS/YdaT
MTRKRTTALIEVILHYGSLASLARELEITVQAVSAWSRVPFKHLSRISKDTGISRQRLRPDLYEDM